MYPIVRTVLLLGLVVSASCADLEGNVASTSKPDGAADDPLRESGSHPFYSTAYTGHSQPPHKYAAVNPDSFAIRDSSTEGNQQASSTSETSGGPSQQGQHYQAFVQPTSFEFGQTINHAVAARAPLSSASSPEQNRPIYSARSEHGAYRAEATVQRGHGASLRYGAGSQEEQDPIHASATDGYNGHFPGSGYGFPQATNRYYGYGGGSSPKGYNTQRAYAYEKVYPEQRYSTNHAVSYEKHYNDDDHRPRGSYKSFSTGYGPSRGGYGSSGEGYGSASEGYGYPKRGYESRYDSNPAATSEGRDGGRPRMRSYVYKNPYDKSTTRVVEMHSGSPGASSNISKLFSKPGGLEGLVASLMRDGKGGFPF